MWNLNNFVIPVVIQSTGYILKHFRTYVNLIPGNHNLIELQKSAVIRTISIIRKVLTLLLRKYLP